MLHTDYAHAEQKETEPIVKLSYAELIADDHKLLLKAAREGDVRAWELLGFMYQRGEGVEVDDILAVYWFTKAAEQGSAEALAFLGSRFLWSASEKKSQQSLTEARILLTKAAKQGHGNAQYDLGGMYLAEQGVPKILSRPMSGLLCRQGRETDGRMQCSRSEQGRALSTI